METIIVEVSLPSINHRYDFALPAGIRIRDIIDEMIQALTQTGQNVAFDTENAVLCDMDSGRVLPAEGTPAGLALRDGSRLILL